MFSKEKANRVITFIELLKHSKGKWQGVPFKLLPWQKEIVSDVFGTLRKSGKRQYKTAYVEVPKKNGKSELAAAIALYMLAADEEKGAEVYGCAADRAQATIVFDVAVKMVEQEPTLRKNIKIYKSIKRMVYYPTGSYYQVLSADAYTKHGINPHAVIFDEIHAQPNRDLWDVMTEGASDAREQPLTFVITTAGKDPNRTSIGWELHKKAIGMKEGHIVDKTFYAKVYGLDENEDWESEENWKKVNPSLGHTVPLETVREHYTAAKGNAAKEFNFKWLRLNMWLADVKNTWLPMAVWDACVNPLDLEALAGRTCYGGLDLSQKLDLTAFVLIFPPEDEDGIYNVLPFFWIPQERMEERVRRDKVPYDRWHKKGYVYVTPGNVIDYRFIQKTIIDLKDKYDIQDIGFDPWNAQQTATELDDEGLSMIEVRQGYKTMSPAMKELEAWLTANRLNHGGNPVLRWNFRNLKVKMDENENIRPVKEKTANRIDGIVALINATVVTLRGMTEEESIYETRGVRGI